MKNKGSHSSNSLGGGNISLVVDKAKQGTQCLATYSFIRLLTSGSNSFCSLRYCIGNQLHSIDLCPNDLITVMTAALTRIVTRKQYSFESVTQNCCSVNETDFSCGGRLFQHVGPDTAKLRGP